MIKQLSLHSIHMYSLKIHKNSNPLRPRVVYHPLSRFLINPLKGKSSSYVKNSVQFRKMIKTTPVHSNQIAVLGVSSLFIKDPADEYVKGFKKMKSKSSNKEHTHIPIDNLMFTFCAQKNNF